MVEKINLSNWKTLYFDGNKKTILSILKREVPKNIWLSAEIPGCNYLDLLKAKKIKDPYFGENFKESMWIQNNDWWYQSEFTIPEINDKKVLLVFEGLDTFCNIYLNGEKISQTKNMFVSYQFDITSQITKGKNILDVHIISPLKVMEIEGISTFYGLLHSCRTFISGLRGIKAIGLKEFIKNIKDLENFEKLLEEKKERNFFNFIKNFQDTFLLRVFTRKSQVNYGWDICVPKFLTSGIWRPAYLQICDGIILKDISAKTNNISTRKNKAEITIEGEIENLSSDKNSFDIDIKIKIKSPDNKVEIEETFPLKLNTKNNYFSFDFEINAPELWFPHTCGIPNLYECEISLAKDNKLFDKKTNKFGIRKVELIKKEDNKNVFTFEINNKKVFCKGANWVPLDILMQPTDEKYIKILNMVKEANMNMLRVWGGGIIEKDIFYNTCDELGIMVWQDFLYSCGFYPDSKKFLEEAKKEGEFIVKKLRGHPSVVIWCGDNENDMICHEKGHPLNRKILPDICKKFDGTRPYHPSSPSGGKHPNDESEGDRHNWTVWHGQKSYRTFSEDMCCFVSEFGLIAYPKEKSFAKFIPKEKHWPQNHYHFWHSCVPFKEKTMLEEYGKAKDIKEHIFLTQIAQAEGIKWALEHYRRRKYKCSGALVWQLSDIWPAISWSIIDYYLEPKISYYFAKKCFAPMLVSFCKEKEKISIYLTSDTDEKIEGIGEVFLENFYGEKLWSNNFKVKVAPDTSEKIFDIPNDILKYSKNEKEEFLWTRINTGGKTLIENYYFLSCFKDQEKIPANISANVEKINSNSIFITIKTDLLARYVEIDCEGQDIKYSDNYFHILPNREIKVKIESKDKLPDKLYIKGYNTNIVEVRV